MDAEGPEVYSDGVRLNLNHYTVIFAFTVSPPGEHDPMRLPPVATVRMSHGCTKGCCDTGCCGTAACTCG
jgi:hypothetical protein